MILHTLLSRDQRERYQVMREHELTSIFINYRREDAAGYAGRLCDSLKHSLGEDQVFMDVESIGAGQDFPQVIEKRITGCGTLLAVIGPHWIDILRTRAVGQDFVREEIACALRSGVRVIPVLVGGTVMPPAESLPDAIAGLSRREALQLHDDQFDSGVERLLQSLNAQGVPMTWSGEWIAEMSKPSQTPYHVRLSLRIMAGKLLGTVLYPTGQAVVRDGLYTSTTISFSTTHIPQFASEPATIQFTGELANGTLELVSVDDSGMATGVARRLSQ
jgi:hypothetical protein